MSNNITTIATLLSGGEGVGIGARAAGLRHLWGIEKDDDIAGVARDNGFNIITAAIQDVDPNTLEAPDVLHASPECQNASNAKNVKGVGTLEEKETHLDVEIAGCIVRYLEVLKPRIFSLENVYGYRRFQSFRMIMVALARLGYFSDVQHLNAADFGVPQTRRRLILRAVRGGLVPQLPQPEPWVGWYEAILDLIPTLPESEFAPWQLARLEIDSSTLVDSAGYVDNDGRLSVQRPSSEPANTIVANHAQRPMRAFILSNAATEWGDGLRDGDEPVHTVTEQSNGRTRAFVVGGQFGKPADGSGEPRPPQTKDRDEPIFCVTAVNKGDWRAWLNEDKPHFERAEDEYKEWRRDQPPPEKLAWLSQGRVVKMTPRCLARFQSFPDSYRLPDHNGLACRVIGNAVPPLMYEKIIRIMSSNPTPAGPVYY